MITDYNWESDNSVRELLSKLIAEKKVIPVLGSGFTRDCKSKNGKVPSGNDMSNYLREFAAKAYGKAVEEYNNTLFPDLCTYYNKRSTTKERFDYFSQNFTEVQLSQDKIDFLRLFPQYMYTLNIDDGIENNCNEYKVILPRRNIYEEYIKQYSTIFKVHGDVHYYLNNIEEEELIFNKRQYIDSIKSNAKMLSRLQDDFANSNLLYIGCSLSEEPDLMSVITEAVKTRRAKCECFYITNRVPDEDKKDLLEDYGITGCLIVDDYNKFYKDLVYYVGEINCSVRSIDVFREPELISLSKDETTLDRILYSNSIVPTPFEGKIYKPTFFTKRDIVPQVISQLRNHSPVHIIYGHRISGKTFCLVDIFDMIKDKTRFFFPSDTKIGEAVLETIFTEKNSLYIFDANSLDSEQIFKIIKEKKTILQNDSYVIIAVNSSDKNGLDLMTENKFYGFSRIKNTFSDSELLQLNKKLQLSNLPTFLNQEIIYSRYKKKNIKVARSLLDNLYMIGERFSKGNDIYNLKIISESSSIKELALLILLATEQYFTTYELFYFDLQKEANQLIKQFPILFSESYYHYNLSRMDSNYKLHSNSRYFLLKSLGEFAKKHEYYEMILNAYKYIFERINNAESDFDTPRKMLDYIKFDVLNDVFYQNNKSVIELIKYVYEGLESVMNVNPQFKHQRAKSILWLCQDEIIEIQNAVKYIDLARHDVEMILKGKFNDKLNISLEHIKYTQASIYGRLCILSNFKDISTAIKSLQYYKEALSSDQNYSERMDFIRKKTEKYIYEDLKGLLEFFIINDESFASDAKTLANELNISLNSTMLID
jgi:hypothetical protein